MHFTTESSEAMDQYTASRRSNTAENVARYVLLVSIANIVVGFILWIIFRKLYPQLILYALFPVVSALAAWGYPQLKKRGQEGMARNLLLGSIILVATAAPLIVADLLMAVAIGFVMILILGYMILPKRATIPLVIIAVGALLLDILAVKLWFIHQMPQLDARAGLMIVVMTGVFGLVGAGLISRQIIQDMYLYDFRAEEAARALEAQMNTEQERLRELQETIDRYVVSLNRVAGGNLTERVEIIKNGHGAGSETDPLVILGTQINAMTMRLQGTMVQIQEVANNLKASASEILAASQQQVSGASEQSVAIGQTTVAVDEVRAISEKTSKRAQEVAIAAQQTEDTSQSGLRSVQETIQVIEGIKGRMGGIAENITALAGRTQQIRQITASVSELASQSNMLALNASIEAARAGDQGKGFAVVASEVRSLSDQSQAATRQIRTILQDIQKATHESVAATEEGHKIVEVGVNLAGRSQTSIRELAQAIEMAKQVAHQLVAGAQEQATGMEQITAAITNINITTMQNLASSRQTEQAAQSLSALSHHLAGMVSRYQI